MKKIFLCVLFFLFLLASSFAMETEPQGYTTFVSKKHGYFIDIPAGFEMDGIEGRLTAWSYHYTSEDPDESPLPVIPMISIVITDIPGQYTEEELFLLKVKRLKEDIATDGSHFTDLDEMDFPLGHAVMIKEIIKDDPQAINHWFLNIYGNRKHYFIDISADYDTLKDWRSIFSHVIASFTLL